MISYFLSVEFLHHLTTFSHYRSWLAVVAVIVVTTLFPGVFIIAATAVDGFWLAAEREFEFEFVVSPGCRTVLLVCVSRKLLSFPLKLYALNIVQM